VIVSDAGPLIVLLQTNKLSILKDLFTTVKVSAAVYNEITVKE
jgi:predicted nucleic acid-binding protein